MSWKALVVLSTQVHVPVAKEKDKDYRIIFHLDSANVILVHL
jgi:hypothetical protein